MSDAENNFRTFVELYKRCRDSGAREIDILTQQYTESHRKYHTLDHIAFMFMKAREHGIQLNSAQLRAIWWHDAVYIPGDSMNEAYSAYLAKRYHAMRDDWDLIEQIIVDTKTHQTTIEESAVVCDLDMLILAQNRDVYQQYTNQIRAEYAQFDDDTYFNSRIKFLISLMERDIYHSKTFKKYEQVAKINVNNELLRLREYIC